MNDTQIAAEINAMKVNHYTHTQTTYLVPD